VKKVRGRWHPGQQQISLAIDLAVARMPIEKAAELLNIGPRTLWLFARRTGMTGIFAAWRDRPRYKPVSSPTAAARTAISAAPVHSDVVAGPAVPGGAEP
jgi:hypothetical protein